MDKKILFLSMFLFFFVISLSAAYAQNEPYIISFQGKLTDYQQYLNSDGKVTVLFGIYGDENRANELWSDYYFVDIDASGIFNVLIGSNPGNPIPSEIFINQSPWLSIHVGGQGGVQLDPPQEITATPYAFVAKNLYGGTVEAISSGVSPAVKGENMAGGGPGVYGLAGTGGGYGVHGINNNAMGYGVFGGSSAGTGVEGRAIASGKAGVSGINNNAAGYGVRGQSTAGYGVMGQSADGYGVYGTSETSGKAGVYGTNSAGYGVFGKAEATDRAGIYGKNDNAGGYGVQGESSTGTGVRGNATATGKAGIHGVNNNAGGYGMWGESSAGTGVKANSSAAGKAGVHAVNDIAGGMGLLAESAAGNAIYAKSETGNAIVATNESETKATVQINNAYQDNTQFPQNFGPALFIEKGKFKASKMEHDAGGNPVWDSPNGAIVGKFSATGNDGVINTAGNATITVKNKYVKSDSIVLLTWKRTGGAYAIPVVYLTAVEDGQFGVHVYADDNESGYQGKTVSVDVYYMVIN